MLHLSFAHISVFRIADHGNRNHDIASVTPLAYLEAIVTRFKITPLLPTADFAIFLFSTETDILLPMLTT